VSSTKDKPPRPKGKRGDASYEQVTIYIRRETHQAIKIELLKDARIKAIRRTDFSDLTQELLEKWLAERVSESPNTQKSDQNAAKI